MTQVPLAARVAKLEASQDVTRGSSSINSGDGRSRSNSEDGTQEEDGARIGSMPLEEESTCV